MYNYWYYIDLADSTLEVDYAHESTGFPTWHRHYLLWLEWEIQYMLKSSRPYDHHKFRLPYWDWRRELQTEENSPFKEKRLGQTINSTAGLPIVNGSLYDGGWYTVCWPNSMEEINVSSAICNPNTPTRLLQRCPDQDRCAVGNETWPSLQDVNDALGGYNIYDEDPFSQLSNSSFRNILQQYNDCDGNVMCFSTDDAYIASKLHNTVSCFNGDKSAVLNVDNQCTKNFKVIAIM